MQNNPYVSAFGNRADGAYACAGTAVNAHAGIDFELAVPHADRTDGALPFAGTTGNTGIANYISHGHILLVE